MAQQYSGHHPAQPTPGRTGAYQTPRFEPAAGGARRPSAGPATPWNGSPASDPRQPAHFATPPDDLATPWAGALGDDLGDDPESTLSAPNRRDDETREDDLDPQGDPAQPRRADWGTTTLTIGPRTAAGTSYLLWWISGLIVYFNERENKFVRFHAVQSILLTGALTIFGVLAYMASSLLGDVYLSTHQAAFKHLSIGVGLLAFFTIIMLWVAPMIAAFSGEWLRLPIVGDYAERYAALPPPRDLS
ncbi:MAG TPA: hypothetical protein VFY89_02885 [Ktedonobacterales bacterium]